MGMPDSITYGNGSNGLLSSNRISSLHHTARRPLGCCPFGLHQYSRIFAPLYEPVPGMNTAPILDSISPGFAVLSAGTVTPYCRLTDSIDLTDSSISHSHSLKLSARGSRYIWNGERTSTRTSPWFTFFAVTSTPRVFDSSSGSI